METSILKSVKKALGIDDTYTVYDDDILMHINSVFGDLNDLGIGPAVGFTVENDETTWVAFLGEDPRLHTVKTYVVMRVRMIFDPPTVGYLVTSLENQIAKMEWRLNTRREYDAWVPPATPEVPEDLL